MELAGEESTTLSSKKKLTWRGWPGARGGAAQPPQSKQAPPTKDAVGAGAAPVVEGTAIAKKDEK